MTLAKMEAPLALSWSRDCTGRPRTLTRSQDTAGRSFVSLLVEEAIAALPVVQAQVVGEVGLQALAVLSTGKQVAPPHHLRRSERKLAPAQRTLARKLNGSKQREQALLQGARVHAKLADQRADGLQKVTTRLMRENQTICVESLAVKQLGPNRSLARAISDAGWGEVVRPLTYKAAWYGRTLVTLEKGYPSATRYSACGHIRASLDLATRSWTCPVGGVQHDRDRNAATNVLAAGLAVNACGEAGRPGRAKPTPARPDEAGIPRL